MRTPVCTLLCIPELGNREKKAGCREGRPLPTSQVPRNELAHVGDMLSAKLY